MTVNKLKALLKEELEINNIPVNIIENKYPAFLQYLVNIFYIKSHENKMHNTGIIISNFNRLPQYEKYNSDDIKYADGHYSFLLITQEAKQIIFFPKGNVDDEVFVEMSRNDNLIIQKISSVLKIFYENNVYTCNNRIWSIKQDIEIAISKIMGQIPQLNRDIFYQIISFSYYSLSSKNVGSTLVYLLSDKYIDHDVEDKRNLLNITEQSHHQMIISYLKQIDGATFISSTGMLVFSGKHLKTSKKSNEIIGQTKGTRHTSAKRYSFDKPDSIVIAVSQDGPVTIFSDGTDLAIISEVYAHEMIVNTKTVIRDEDIDYREKRGVYKCAYCGKTNSVYTNSVSEGRNTQKNIHCALCGKKIAIIKCMKHYEQIIKNIEEHKVS